MHAHNPRLYTESAKHVMLKTITITTATSCILPHALVRKYHP